MKTKSKALLLTLCAVLLVAASMLGTMAYLTSTDEVKNTFTVGQVKITLDEAQVNGDGKPINKDGKVVTDLAGAERVKANSYKLLPGHEYKKDPTIHVDANSEDCFLFVKVENEIADIEKAGTEVAEQMAKNGWVTVEGQTKVYVYVGKTTGATNPATVQAGTNVDVFEKLAIDGNVDNNTLNGYAGKTIKVTAYAVQKDGFEGKSAKEIWTNAGFNTTVGA